HSTIPLLLPSHPHHLPNTIPLVQFPETTPSFTSPSSLKHNSYIHTILHLWLQAYMVEAVKSSSTS
ncbi:unnamed protein product, partial [Prunus brigantina]